uniref:Reverse transcriptase domain-containing protein n=1 Tax=Tanacetum cinerariifolium TaxID=118510 RepID=A0A6L2LM87_TANCI|nr:hypothetical protein [Tanacetum cinerariifolium]
MYNFLAYKPRFLEVVADQWSHQIDGCAMFRVVKRMKLLKKPIRKLLNDQGNIHERVANLRVELDAIQIALDTDPLNEVLQEEEAVYLTSFNEAKLDEERFLKQKAKAEWLDVGDSNSAYFHKTIKGRNQRNRIEIIRTIDNEEVTGAAVPQCFVEHYKNFLGSNFNCMNLDFVDLFRNQVSEGSCTSMIRPISNDEIKRAMFDIGDDKAPGPDGFTSVFFKKAWDTVGMYVCVAIREFFMNGKILKEINHTFLALIPKVATPMKVTDFRPISCCNVIYKCTSKIITNRIIAGIKEVVSENQSAFVPGRRISGNILITQELMHNYHRNVGPPRCAFKVDIQKAYDTVDWHFLECILKQFGFLDKMVKWVVTCVTTASFSLHINGDVHGFFEGKRGLRQGDPMSPYLFTLVMEALTLMLQRRVRNSESFRYHKQCEELQIINVCFADDLFLFTYGDMDSVKLIMDTLDEFKLVSGIINDIEQLMRGFLWCNGDLKKGKAKVAWRDICLPKNEGGLGLRSLEIFNLALMTTHIWSIASNRESLWVRWIHTYKLCGNRKSTSLWYDRWCSLSPLSNLLSPRDIHREGYFLITCVADIITNGSWNWPLRWLAKAHDIANISVPVLSDRKDCILWRDLHGKSYEFSVRNGWETLKAREDVCSWHNDVWFTHGIPRHSFHLWFVMRRSLKTQDMLRPWDVGPATDLSSLRYPLCNNQQDSHEHLFFECAYAAKVWGYVRDLADLNDAPPVLMDIVDLLQQMGKSRKVRSIFRKLILAATAYFIWNERNSRLFKNRKRSPEDIRDVIMVVSSKGMSLVVEVQAYVA